MTSTLAASHPLAGVLSLDEMIVDSSETLIQAMRAINEGSSGVAFVCDANKRVMGTVTDGDLRRALLAGATLETRCLPEIMKRSFVSLRPQAGRAEALDLMRVYDVSQIPVLDEAGRLVGLHLLRQFLGPVDRPNAALLLAGGKGTRLLPLTAESPKPMLCVAGRPILERLVLHLISAGIRRIFIAINHLGHIIEEHFKDGSQYGCHIEYLRETKPLGTGGPLSLLPKDLTAPVVTLNGDLVTQADIGQCIDFHVAHGFTATFGLRPHTVPIPYGVARVDGEKLIDLEEKPRLELLINAGIYVLSQRAIDSVPQDTDFPITDLFQRLLQVKEPVGAFVFEEDWIDVGVPAELRRAQGHL